MTDHNHSKYFFSSENQPLEALHENSSFIFYPILLLLFFSACNETFEPWQENDQYHFSIYGVLDATTDTQWVRVMPVREELFLEPVPIDATVTLEHLESGDTVVLNDSLFEFAHNAFAYNFWTTMNLQPGQSYQLTAERLDGIFSRTKVTLPAEFPAPLLLIQYSRRGAPEKATIFLEGIERLADVKTVYGNVRIAHLKDTVRTSLGDLRIVMDVQEDLQVVKPFFSNITAGSMIGPSSSINPKIYIASAGGDYHHFGSITENTIALPEGVSNIENGVGYLAGVVSMTLPYESCEENMNFVPCEPVPPPWSKIPAPDLYLIK